MSEQDFFEKFGLEVKAGEVEVGKTYPLYGAVVKIVDESVENFTIELSSGVVLKCTLKSAESAETIKKRAFEPGIFIAQITETTPVVKGLCETICFGRMQNQDS